MFWKKKKKNNNGNILKSAIFQYPAHPPTLPKVIHHTMFFGSMKPPVFN